MAIKHVAFIMYPVSDMARSIAFYENVIGLKRAGLESGFWTEFEIEGVTFGLGNFPQVGTPGTAQSLALEIDDLPAYRAALEKQGVTSTEPFETPVCWISVANDPDGNGICLHQAKA